MRAFLIIAVTCLACAPVQGAPLGHGAQPEQELGWQGPSRATTLAWDAERGLVTCLGTGTSLRVPLAWRPEVRATEQELSLRLAATPSGLFLVRAGAEPLSVEDVATDALDGHQLLYQRAATRIQLSSVSGQPGLAGTARYVEDAADAGFSESHLLRFVLVSRNGASCRLLVLTSDGESAQARALLALLDSVRDSQWLERVPGPRSSANEDALRLALAAGAYLALGAPR